jgi:hypothetical protein
MTINNLSDFNKELDVLFYTNFEKYIEKLNSIDCSKLIELDKILRTERANDPNFSYAKERVTCMLAGFEHHELSMKHGLDSVVNGGESKPESIILGGKKEKLTGIISFADMELHKIDYFYDNDVTILSSGFVGNTCLYVVGIKMKNDIIKNRLIEQHASLKKLGKRKVLNFSRTHYVDDVRNKLYYINPNFDNFIKNMSTPQYNFIKKLSYMK